MTCSAFTLAPTLQPPQNKSIKRLILFGNNGKICGNNFITAFLIPVKVYVKFLVIYGVKFTVKIIVIFNAKNDDSKG